MPVELLFLITLMVGSLPILVEHRAFAILCLLFAVTSGSYIYLAYSLKDDTQIKQTKVVEIIENKAVINLDGITINLNERAEGNFTNGEKIQVYWTKPSMSLGIYFSQGPLKFKRL